MPERITKTQRWLDLIALLLNRRIPLEVDEIMERIPAYARSWSSGDDTTRASLRRTFERDKDELRAMGIPIESTRYEINYGGEVVEGYRIKRGDFYLPYLRVLSGDSESNETGHAAIQSHVDLAPEQARIALDALREIAAIPAFPFSTDALSALNKLTFDIDPDQFPAIPVIQLERPDTARILERLRILSDALLAGKRVRFRYHGIHRGVSSEREVEPYGLFLNRDWYLVARDAESGEIRLFRASRMERPSMNTKAPKKRDFLVPPDFDLKRFVGRRAWELSADDPIQVRVLFRFPSSLLVDRNRTGELISEQPDGSALRRFEVSDPNPFLRWVLSFAGEADIVSPPEMREALRKMAQEVTALYAGRHD